MKRMSFIIAFFCLIFCCPAFGMSDGYLMPESSSRYLTESDIYNMSPQMLCYTRNEIYAKHGRLFKSVELTEYFNTKSWYHGTIAPDKFDESIFNQFERANVAFLWDYEHANGSSGYKVDQPGYNIYNVASGSSSYSDQPSSSVVTSMMSGNIEELGISFELDLDGNGTSESITMTPEGTVSTHEFNGIRYNYADGYELYVNDASVSGKEDLLRWTVYGVSLDRESILLLIFSEGPSDDPTTEFFKYENGNLRSVGKIYDWINKIDIVDDTIYASERINIIETSRIDKIWNWNGVLEKITEIPQDVYTMYNYGGNRWGIEYLNEDIYVYVDRNDNSDMVLMPAQNVIFPYTDGERWIFIEGAEGDEGWLPITDYDQMEVRELFSGLMFAD